MSSNRFSPREKKLVGHFLWMSFLTLLSGSALLGIIFYDVGPGGPFWTFGMVLAFVSTSLVSVFLVFQLKGDPEDLSDASG